MQPLANIVLKQNKVGSTVTVRNVTPAEMFVLIADFRDLAGDNPIVKLDEIPEGREDEQILPLMERLDALRTKYKKDSSDPEILEETRNSRLQSTSQAIIRVEKNIKEWQWIKSIRSFSAAQEKARLKLRYQGKLVDHLFPGRFPTVPDSFETAKTTGLDPNLMDGMDETRESFLHTARIS